MILWLLALTFLASPGLAAPVSSGPAYAHGGFPLVPVSAQTPMEVQMMGEKPLPSHSSPLWSSHSPLAEISPGLGSDRHGTFFRLPGSLNLRISFLYSGESPALAAESPARPPLLFKYSMDFGVLPNLQVGLSGFLFHPYADNLAFSRRYGNMAMGWGPGIKYDLGRWSFTLKSQLETGSRERGEDLQNWFRIWYAF
ncbi:MAG: hypothetical protein AB1491_08980 [Thermodesulfobacteriota bacterium]